MIEYLIFAISLIIIFYLGQLIGKLKERSLTKDKLAHARKDSVKRSRAVIQGQISEQLSPYLPGFNHEPADAKFIGKPIDFIVFEGLSNKKIDKVVFVEVKTASSSLSKIELELKHAIKNKKVEWEEFRIDK